MTRSQLIVTIRRPIEDVFAVLSDVENTPRWHPQVIEEHRISDGPVRVGSTRRATGQAFGIRETNEAEVTVFEPPSALGERSISGRVPFEISIHLTPVPEGTEIIWTTDLRPTGFHRLVVFLTAAVQRRLTKHALENLRRLMEVGEL